MGLKNQQLHIPKSKKATLPRIVIYKNLGVLALIRPFQQVKTLTINYIIYRLWTIHQISIYIITFYKVGFERQEILNQKKSYLLVLLQLN